MLIKNKIITFIKSTSVKSILHILFIISVINFILPINSLFAHRFTVQVAASRTPLNIQDFSNRHKISDPVREVFHDGWYRYLTGNFDDLKSATKFAGDLSLRTGIPGVFTRNLEESPESLVPVQAIASGAEVKIMPDPAVSAASDSSAAVKMKSTAVSAMTEEKTIRKSANKGNELFLRVFGKKNILELQKELILYGNKNLPLFVRKFYVRLIEKTYTYPIILLFVFLIIIFLLNILFVLLFLYYSNKQKNRREKYIRIFGNLYEDVLRRYLFDEIPWESALAKLKRINKPLNRRILTSVLINFQENLRGEMDTRMSEIFFKIGLHTDALKSVRSSLYYKKVIGIRELTNLYPKGTEEIIGNYINHPNDLVRAEAQTSYIRLHPDQPFGFLRQLTSPFTRWTQLTAFYLFRLHQLPVPAFIDYMDSEHPTVRNFCLWMIVYFQQLENASEILNLLHSKMELTRFLSIRAVNDLRLYQGKELLKDRYRNETEKNRMEIIKAFKNIGNSEDYGFLENIIRSGSVTAKTEACRSLYFMNSEGPERLALLQKNAGLEIEKYLAHVSDLRN